MERSFWSTIRGKLLSRTLLVALLPILVIGGVAIASLRSLSGTADDSLASARETLSDEVVGTRVAGVSEQIARELASFLDERVADAQGWSTDVGFGDAARAASGRAIVMGLPDMDVDELEARFAGEPRLGDVHVERDLLTAVSNTPSFKEIFITDQHGFNVDYSNPTSDFVQYDEDWWVAAMDDGLHISEPEFDASAGVFAVDISVRVEHDGAAIGVLKASLDMNVVQIIADRYAGGTEAYDVTVVDQIGRFLAETSTGHQADHIMNPAFVATNPTVSTEFVREAFAANANELHADGHSISDQGVAGYAHVGEQLDTLRGDTRSTLTAFNWNVIVEQPASVAFAALAPLEGLASQVSTTSSGLTLVVMLVALFGAVAAAAMALIVGARIAQPIARLRDAVVRTAEVTLPNVVAQIDALEDGEEVPELEPFTLVTNDEVEDLAHSFNTVQQTAADLASEQARLRRTNVATTFVNLGRRNQNLLARQLEHINSMEGNETNADTLQRLFELDHLATRMRRNAESLLVLAGEDTPRRFRKPVSIHKVVQAAGGEIEDFARVELTSLEDSYVEGSAASDIAHLLAELLENASTFSPPETRIQVHGRRRADSYLLAVVDRGIGMGEADLNAANARLADPAEFDSAPSAYLGHFVVGRLAKRHGIRVRLADSPYGGLAAQLHLPASILTNTDRIDDVDTRSPAPAAIEEASIEATPTMAPPAAVEEAPIEAAPTMAPPAAIEEAPIEEVPTMAPPAAIEEAPTLAEALPNFAAEMAEPSPTELTEAEQAELAVLELAFLDDAPDTIEAAAVQPEPSHPAPGQVPVADIVDLVESPAPTTPESALQEQPLQEAPMYEQPAPGQSLHLVPSSPEAEFAAASAAVESLTAEAVAASSPVEITPSGFRRRVRGQEGAPQSATAIEDPRNDTQHRRDPEQVQASLQRFRQGVESGRAQAHAESNNDQSVVEGDNQ